MFSAVFEPAQFGSWLMSIFAAFGAAPSNFTVPLTEPTVAGSIGVAVGAGVAATEGAGCSSSFLPHPAIKTRPGKTLIASHFFVFMMSLHLASNLKLAQTSLATVATRFICTTGCAAIRGSRMSHGCAHSPLLFRCQLENVVHQQLRVILIVTLEGCWRGPRKDPVIILLLEEARGHRRTWADRLWVNNPALHPIRLEPTLRLQKIRRGSSTIVRGIASRVALQARCGRTAE